MEHITRHQREELGAPLDVGFGCLVRGLKFEVRSSGGDVLVSLAKAGSGMADTVREQMLTSPYETTELVPSVLRLGPGGLELLAERSDSPNG
ncbi:MULTISPECIES: hypothetical protein [Amycolatopsis]|uniref:hypothetical protein n=1 Tax=Amycolatopsis TaxID=1813 RepID=UPI0007DF7666|nr:MULTISPECIES: hypothetical protein [Amycolatopsis]OAP27538.1 hypothetical protein A4R44_01141 [Amycolatopsis sp. M39]